MPHLVRAGVRFNRWLDTEGREPSDFPADVITDLRTMGDDLSVFEVTDSVSAERIATALAAAPGKREPDHTAYAIFDRAALQGLEINIGKTPGSTIDTEVNAAHYDLHVGTARRLVELAGVIAGGNIVPVLKARVAELLRAGFESGHVDHNKNRLLCDRVKADIRRDRDTPHTNELLE